MKIEVSIATILSNLLCLVDNLNVYGAYTSRYYSTFITSKFTTFSLVRKKPLFVKYFQHILDEDGDMFACPHHFKYIIVLEMIKATFKLTRRIDCILYII